MDPIVQRSLDTFGFAQVIAVMRQDAGAAASFGSLEPAVTDLFLPAPPNAAAAFSVAPRRPPPPAIRQFPRLGLVVGYVDPEGASALEAHSQVEDVQPAEPLSLIRPVASASAAYTPRVTWGIRSIGADKLWAKGLTGKGVRVGHLDTGVDAGHPALKGRVTGFAEFDLFGERVANAKAYDSDEHGTHTAGTIVGGKIRGMAIGVAPEADLFSGLVIEGGHVLLRVLAGMEWCLEENVRVLSMSLGIRGFTPFAVAITQRLRQQGILPVFAIGNEGPNTSRSPGNYPEALSVGAMDARKRVAAFSSSIVFNRPEEPNQPNLVAPGVGITSARAGGGGLRLNGTSMATPHVAGLAALLWQAKPDASVDEIEAALLGACDPLKKDDVSRFGRGLANGPRAVAQLLGS